MHIAMDQNGKNGKIIIFVENANRVNNCFSHSGELSECDKINLHWWICLCGSSLLLMKGKYKHLRSFIHTKC